MFKKIVFLIIPIILIFSHLSHRIRTWYRVQKEIGEIKENIQQLEKEQTELKSKKEFYQTEEFIQREARENLGLTDNNDLIVVLPELPDLSSEKLINSPSPDLPVWKQWWDVFFAKT